MSDRLDEEARIMEERTKKGRTLSIDTLRNAIATICRRPAEVIEAGQSVAAALILMNEHRIGSLAVVESEFLVGIVTERDILTKVAADENFDRQRPVSDIMTPDPETLRKDDSILFVMNKMHLGGFRHVPIVDEEGRPLYVISVRDVLRLVHESFETEIATLPPDPFHGEPSLHSG